MKNLVKQYLLYLWENDPNQMILETYADETKNYDYLDLKEEERLDYLKNVILCDEDFISKCSEDSALIEDASNLLPYKWQIVKEGTTAFGLKYKSIKGTFENEEELLEEYEDIKELIFKYAKPKEFSILITHTLENGEIEIVRKESFYVSE